MLEIWLGRLFRNRYKGGNVNSKPVSVHKSAPKVLNQSFSLSDRSADYLVTDKKEKAVGMDGTSSLQQIKWQWLRSMVLNGTWTAWDPSPTRSKKVKQNSCNPCRKHRIEGKFNHRLQIKTYDKCGLLNPYWPKEKKKSKMQMWMQLLIRTASGKSSKRWRRQNVTDVWETTASHEKTAVEQKKQIVGKSDRISTASVFLYVCVCKSYESLRATRTQGLMLSSD